MFVKGKAYRFIFILQLNLWAAEATLTSYWGLIASSAGERHSENVSLILLFILIWLNRKRKDRGCKRERKSSKTSQKKKNQETLSELRWDEDAPHWDDCFALNTKGASLQTFRVVCKHRLGPAADSHDSLKQAPQGGISVHPLAYKPAMGHNDKKLLSRRAMAGVLRGETYSRRGNHSKSVRRC